MKPKGNVHLFPSTVAPDLSVDRQPDDGVIKLLQGLLARALTGELRAVGAAYVKLGNFTSYEWAQSGSSIHQLGASIGDLAFAFARARAKCADDGEAMPGANE